MAEKVTKLALASRIIILVLQLLSNRLCPDHKPDVFRSPKVTTTTTAEAAAAATATATENQKFFINSNNATISSTSSPTWLDNSIEFCFGGLRNWDGEYFLHITEHGYSYENTLAFYPLYPLVVRSGAGFLHYVMGFGLSLSNCILLVSVAVNIFCFCKAANALYDLTQRIFNDSNKSWNAALLFCFNPASIFFSAAYSEALFSWLSFNLMLECVTELRFIWLTVTLAASIICRSNGLTNIGYPVYFLMRRLVLKNNSILTLAKLLSCALISLLPLTLFYSFAYQQFCNMERQPINHSVAIVNYARERNYILAGHRQKNQSPWCEQSIPYPYSYIQSHYWNVGFLRYYAWKQLPNFLLALPTIAWLFYHCCTYLKHFCKSLLFKYPLKQLLREYKSLPFIVHALFLTVFCTLFVHIQISTRLLASATPCLFWFAADYFPKTFDQVKIRSKAGCILTWFTCYYLIGTILFSNNFPWT